jgi:hypothetical protein
LTNWKLFLAKLERESFYGNMQAEGFRIRMEQLLEENAKLKAV